MLYLTFTFIIISLLKTAILASNGRHLLREQILPVHGPKIIWLMSFPGSGTTYTEMIVQDSTGNATANNYGTGRFMTNDKKVVEGIEPKQLYAQRVNGPFLTNDLDIPKKYIVTRTHCLNTCYDCPPINYISRGRFWFYSTCLMGTKFDPSTITTLNVQYDGGLVHKAIHIIRDPFSNIVSRFLKHFKWGRSVALSPSSPDNSMIADISNDKNGFQEYCQQLDEKFYKHEIDMFPDLMHNKTLNIHAVPCRSEFYKYIQWHNLAFVATNDINPMPMIVIHYEEYCNDLNTTLQTILDFIEMERKSKFHVRIPHCHNYKYFFDDNQLFAIQAFIRYMAKPVFLEELLRYFNPNVI